MSIEEVIDRAVQLNQEIEIEYCTRNGRVFTCRIADIKYSNYYGGMYIQASFSRIFWKQIGDDFKRIY